MAFKGGSLLCPLHAFYIWQPDSAPKGLCVKLRRRLKCQEPPAEPDEAPRAILVYSLPGAPAFAG
jgi:hypothetical protein